MNVATGETCDNNFDNENNNHCTTEFNFRNKERKTLAFLLGYISVIVGFFIFAVLPPNSISFSFPFFRDVLLWILPFLVLFGYKRGVIINAIHEGLHAVAGMWLLENRQGLIAEEQHTYIVGKVPVKIWHDFVLFPLLFPIAIFFFVCFTNPKTAITIFCLLTFLSASDIVDALIVSKNKCDYVEDNSEGLFLYLKDEQVRPNTKGFALLPLPLQQIKKWCINHISKLQGNKNRQ
jgi:hypothetical protein